MGQADSKQLVQILYGIVNGDEWAKESLRNTYMPLIHYISTKYITDLNEHKDGIFKYIEDGVSVYLFANIERKAVSYADPFTLWFVSRLQEYFEDNNMDMPGITEEITGNIELMSSIKPVVPESKTERTVEQTTNQVSPVNTVKKSRPAIKEYPQKKVMALITFAVFAICMIAGNFIPEIYVSESEGIQYTVTVNKKAYYKEETVVIDFTLKNTSDQVKVLLSQHIKSAPINNSFDSVRTPAYFIQPGEEYTTQLELHLLMDLDKITVSFTFNDFITDVTIPIYVKKASLKRTYEPTAENNK